MHRPFQILDEWVRQGRIHLVADPRQPEAPVDFFPNDLSEEDLFAVAMRDVRPLGWSAVPLELPPPLEIQGSDDEEQALRALREFCRHGDIELEQTAEYIERAIDPYGRLYLDDLRSGRFSIQAHLDLHGLDRRRARVLLERFLNESVRAGYSCVRVVHGRGRHSPRHRPILKENIQRWLSTRRISRYVVAYTSARTYDGGGGAIYVLMRG